MVKVSVGEVRIEHEVKFADFMGWLERPPRSPRERQGLEVPMARGAIRRIGPTQELGHRVVRRVSQRIGGAKGRGCAASRHQSAFAATASEGCERRHANQALPRIRVAKYFSRPETGSRYDRRTAQVYRAGGRTDSSTSRLSTWRVGSSRSLWRGGARRKFATS